MSSKRKMRRRGFKLKDVTSKLNLRVKKVTNKATLREIGRELMKKYKKYLTLG